ncbi:PRC-barrel domain-containing protein [Poseidonocella sedimentorum]|uniref:PRC-barrel domain-containing protein n=1 Tax=Poseidonocella sedimentorum TaxID=871652 RepID=A0A1I6E0T4_9RHOB|nr:PRC-barrel domain-containing protein [Poseidonocella sedimentorum]SFR11359.1 PRC-barrel domain-containing protein [Poseidonocella sedimentorum]
MKGFLATTAMVLVAGTPLLADTTLNADAEANVETNAEIAAESAETSIEEGVASTANAAEEMADEGAQMASDAANAIEEAGEDAVETAEELGNDAANTVDGLANDASQTADMIDDTDGEIDVELQAETKMADAHDANASAEMDYSNDIFLGSETMASGAFSASTLIGKSVYTTEVDYAGEATAEADADWNNIGEVSDILLGADGKMQSVILDIGGFLGLGEHTVAVNLDKLSLVADADDAGEYFVVVQSTKDELMAAPEFEIDAVGEATMN